MNRRTTAVLAIILLIAIGILLWRPSILTPQDGQKPSSGDPSITPTHWSSGRPKVPSKLPRDTPHHHNRHATHSPEELRNFIIPEFPTNNATIEETLEALFRKYNEICLNTGETPLKFNYHIEGTPSSSLTINLKQVSFLRALRIIAARSGLVLERDGTKLVFSPITREPTEELVTRRFSVPPTFLQDAEKFLYPTDPVPTDPFAPDTDHKPIDLQRVLPVEMLAALGIVQSSNADATYVASSSALLISASAADQARFDTFLENEFLNTRPVMFHTTTKFIESDNPLTFEKTSFSDEEYQVVMRSLAQTKGVNIMTQPSVTSRPGQSATIEIGREVLILDPDNNGDFTKDWIGCKTHVNSGQYGFDLQSNITNEIREAMGDATDTIKGVTADSSQHHPAGHTVLIESTSPGGTPVYIFATTRRIDATGRPYDPRKPAE